MKAGKAMKEERNRIWVKKSEEEVHNYDDDDVIVGEFTKRLKEVLPLKTL